MKVAQLRLMADSINNKTITRKHLDNLMRMAANLGDYYIRVASDQLPEKIRARLILEGFEVESLYDNATIISWKEL